MFLAVNQISSPVPAPLLELIDYKWRELNKLEIRNGSFIDCV